MNIGDFGVVGVVANAEKARSKVGKIASSSVTTSIGFALASADGTVVPFFGLILL